MEENLGVGPIGIFDIRVFYPNTKRYLNTALSQCYEQNENYKKRKYNKRIFKIDHGTFTSLIFSIYGSMD